MMIGSVNKITVNPLNWSRRSKHSCWPHNRARTLTLDRPNGGPRNCYTAAVKKRIVFALCQSVFSHICLSNSTFLLLGFLRARSPIRKTAPQRAAQFVIASVPTPSRRANAFAYKGRARTGTQSRPAPAQSCARPNCACQMRAYKRSVWPRGEPARLRAAAGTPPLQRPHVGPAQSKPPGRLRRQPLSASQPASPRGRLLPPIHLASTLATSSAKPGPNSNQTGRRSSWRGLTRLGCCPGSPRFSVWLRPSGDLWPARLSVLRFRRAAVSCTAVIRALTWPRTA